MLLMRLIPSRGTGQGEGVDVKADGIAYRTVARFVCKAVGYPT